MLQRYLEIATVPNTTLVCPLLQFHEIIIITIHLEEPRGSCTVHRTYMQSPYGCPTCTIQRH